MYKLGRAGAGRGGGKRSLPPPPPSLHRPGAKGARGPIGGPPARNRHGAPGTSKAPAAPPAREEAFSLVPGDIDFGSIIKLTPDIIEEIKRVEAQGGEARIKFDSNPNNANENNVIDVGGKEFKFTWAREPGDLCDIYEEQQSGEDGQGMLAECGSAWRKLNVERILDESTKNHVKMLSVEAERHSKSRKAIVLDHANPSVKNQVKSMAAAGVDGSNRRGNWTRKEPPQKKQRIELSQGPPRPASKAGISSNATTKGRRPVSPPSSPPRMPERGTSVSPFGTGKASNLEGSIDPFNIGKEVLGNLENEMANNALHGATDEVNEQNCAIGDQELDLRNILINLLSKNPKGMTLKALEKTVGDTFPKSAKKIENIIKKIATFQAPGKYLLKPGVEVETSKTRVSDGRYEEYVLEYREKYSDYLSVNKSLEDIRNDFLQLGNDLKDAKERDMGEYYIIQEEVKQMYIQKGESHKRLKKIFLLLHEEIKTLKVRIKDFAEAYEKD